MAVITILSRGMCTHIGMRRFTDVRAEGPDIERRLLRSATLDSWLNPRNRTPFGLARSYFSGTLRR